MAVAAVILPFVSVSRTCTTPNVRRPSLTVTALPVTVFVALDGVGEGLGVGLGVGFADDFVGVGEAFVALGAAAEREVDGAGVGLLAGTLDGRSLARAEAAAELAGGPDDPAGGPEDPGVGLANASGCGPLVGVSLKLSRTTRPATVATNTATKRRTAQPPPGT
jgi:hypothetical protein